MITADALEEMMARARQTQTPAALPTARAPEQPAVTPREVVIGIKLNVSGRELGVRLAERIRWHREKADALLAQMSKLAEVERDARDALANAFGRYDSPRAMLGKKLDEHRDRAAFLTFLRDHVDADQLYRLDSTDLRMTEILPDRPW